MKRRKIKIKRPGLAFFIKKPSIHLGTTPMSVELVHYIAGESVYELICLLSTGSIYLGSVKFLNGIFASFD